MVLNKPRAPAKVATEQHSHQSQQKAISNSASQKKT